VINESHIGWILLVLVSLLSVSSFGQSNFDQIFEETIISVSNEGKGNPLRTLLSELSKVDPHEGLDLLDTWVRTRNVDKEMAFSHYRIEAARGYLYLHTGQYLEAAISKTAAYSFAAQAELWESCVAALCGAGNAYNLNKNTDSALVFVDRAIEVCRSKNLEYLLKNPYIVRSDVYKRLGQNEDAKTTLILAYNLPEDPGDKHAKNFLLYNMIELFYEMNDLESYAKYTAILLERMNQDGKTEVKNHFPIRTLLLADNSKESIDKLLKLIDITEELGANKYRAMYSTAMTLCKALENTPEGPKILEPILINLNERLEASNSVFWRAMVNEKLSEVCAKQGRFEEALLYQKRKEDFVISSRQLQEQRELAELEIKYDTEKKENEILEQKLIIERQNQIKNLTWIGLGILALIILGVMFVQKNRIKYEKKLRKEELTSLQKVNDLKIANALISGQEAERLRISQDLHDGLGGMLSTIKHQVEMLGENMQTDELFNKTELLVDNACKEVRRIAHNMTPNALHLAGLKGAVEDVVHHVNSLNIEAELEMIGDISIISEGITLHIFRIIQELVNNVVKHSEANTHLVQVVVENNFLDIIVEDNGKGMDMSASNNKTGMGIENISSRVAYLNGHVDFDTRLGDGTTVTINIPLNFEIYD